MNIINKSSIYQYDNAVVLEYKQALLIPRFYEKS